MRRSNRVAEFDGRRRRRKSDLPVRFRQVGEGLFQAIVPGMADLGPIGVALIDAALEALDQAVAPVTKQVDGRSDRNIRAHGRIEGDQRAARRLGEPGLRGDDPVEDRFAVLDLADLKVGRIPASFDEVAGAIEAKEPGRLPLDLSAKKRLCAIGDAMALEVAAFAVVDIAQRIADQPSG